MLNCDIAIIGGGLAGSTTAAMLARSGLNAMLIDPYTHCRPDFRCEKFDARQIELLQKTGLKQVAFAAATQVDRLWVARFGRLLDKKPNNQCSFEYQTMVNAIRAAAADRVPQLVSKAVAIEAGAKLQRVTLADGRTVEARLVVVATGLNIGLRRALGIERDILSAGHSISIGFDLAPRDQAAFRFPALTYFPESRFDRMAYLTLFPIGEVMRANLFVYRDMDDPWLGRFRRQPEETLFALLPRLKRMTGDIEISAAVKIRPVDLYTTSGHRQAGIVLVGDAFSTSCPAAGTGAHKVFTDVERLCHSHIPQWLSTPGMGAEKIGQFYDDPVKTACEADSLSRAYQLRAISLESGPAFGLRRLIKFAGHFAIGMARKARRRQSGVPAFAPSRQDPATAPGAARERVG